MILIDKSSPLRSRKKSSDNEKLPMGKKKTPSDDAISPATTAPLDPSALSVDETSRQFHMISEIFDQIGVSVKEDTTSMVHDKGTASDQWIGTHTCQRMDTFIQLLEN